MGTPAITVPAALTQEAEKSGLSVGTLCLKVETTWGPPTCLEEAAPTELPASDAAPQRRCPQPVLAAVWDCRATPGPQEEEGCRGAPFQAHRPCLNTVRTLHSGAPPGARLRPTAGYLSPLAPPWAWGSPPLAAVDAPQSLGWVSTDPAF